MTKILRRRSRKHKRRTPEEWKDIIIRFDDLKNRISTSVLYVKSDKGLEKTAADRLGVSVSSVHRWRRNLLKEAVTDENSVSLGEETFSDILSDCFELRIVASIRFTCWLRWPSQNNERHLAYLTCLATYIYQKDLKSSLSNNESKICDVFKRECKVGTLSEVLLGRIGAPNFDMMKYYASDDDEIDLYVDIVEYFIAHKNEELSLKNSPSLNQAAFLIDQNAMRTTYTSRTFWDYWARMGASAPFWYVARKHSELRWDVDPNRSDFAESMDLLVSRRKELARFVSQSRWTVDEFTRAMRKQASVGGRFPTFPTSVAPMPITIPPLSESFRKLLSAYRA